MMRLGLILTWAMVWAGAAAVAQAPLDRFDIAINAEDERDQSTIFTLANTFAMLSPRTSGLRRASRLDFRSGVDLVQGGAATAKLRSALPEQVGASVARLNDMQSPCDVSRHRFDDTDVLVVVHNDDGTQEQGAHRCFVAGLWIYHAGGNQGVNVDNWRVPYARIISSVAGGRPAFGGFDTGDN